MRKNLFHTSIDLLFARFFMISFSYFFSRIVRLVFSTQMQRDQRLQHFILDHISPSMVCYELVSLNWIGLDWIGLDWIGLDWIGWVPLPLSLPLCAIHSLLDPLPYWFGSDQMGSARIKWDCIVWDQSDCLIISSKQPPLVYVGLRMSQYFRQKQLIVLIVWSKDVRVDILYTPLLIGFHHLGIALHGMALHDIA